MTNSYIQNIKSLAVNRSIPLLGSVCIISCLPCLHENFQKKLSSVVKHCWVGCPNILNFSTFYILHGKIYIVKWHENWQKIIIFRKMGITLDWDILSSWTFHCCVSFLVLSCWILIMAMLYYVWATLVHGHNGHNSHFRLLWPLWPWPLTFLTYPWWVSNKKALKN